MAAMTRVTLGLASLTTSLLLIVTMSGLFPSHRAAVEEGRSRLCEAVALHFPLLADMSNSEALRTYQALVERDPDLVSIVVRRDDGSLFAEVTELGRKSNDTRTPPAGSWVRIPLAADGQAWGWLEAKFRPSGTFQIAGHAVPPELIHAIVCSLLCFCVHYAYLRRLLRQLNASVNGSPTGDERGIEPALLASFEDVTGLEQKRRELKSLVEHLRTSSDEIKRQNRELEHLATRDPLTGCLNRRSFLERVEGGGTSREPQQALVMVDVDHFKAVNDNHGHSVGDNVLRTVAAALLASSRPNDLVCRFGGEEFAVFVPDADMEGGCALAERIRLAIERLEFEQLGITASLGVSASVGDPCAIHELLDQADKALYVAKRNGRNQVVRWDRLGEYEKCLEASSENEPKTATSVELAPVPFQAVTALFSALAYRDPTTAEHSRRVADLCVATGQGLLTRSACYTLEIAALLHDIGKVGVPDSILLKPGRLSDAEWKVMQRNEMIGTEIIRSSFACDALTATVVNASSHFGGTASRPDAPVGQQIPLAARILAIANAYDSMVTQWAHRAGRSQAEAFAELRRCAGGQFDPELVERFIGVLQSLPETHVSPRCVSKQVALGIGLQMERLCRALDEEDFDSLGTLSRRLHDHAHHYGAADIADKAGKLEASLGGERDLIAIIQSANELIDLCRSTQSTLLDQAYVP